MGNIDVRTDFSILRYANCWEDADVLLGGLQPCRGSRILSIGSAGDNSFSLLSTDPTSVVAVDLSKTQLALIALKKAAMQYLPYEELLAFLGFRPSEDRLETLDKLRHLLEEQVFDYWKSQLGQINRGIVTQGKFERYFQLFSCKILPWIHSQKTIDQLFTPKSPQRQEAFYHDSWNTWRWRLLFKLFFSKSVMGRFGRDPEFLKEVEVSVGRTIFNRAERQLRSAAAQHNFMLRYNLKGSFGNLLPHYLLPENYKTIKPNLHKLHLYEGYAEDALDKYGMVDFMNLSNIFEYMDKQTFETTTKRLVDGISPGGRLAYWNLMVPRRMSTILPERLSYRQELSERLTAVDKGFFYERFIVDECYG